MLQNQRHEIKLLCMSTTSLRYISKENTRDVLRLAIRKRTIQKVIMEIDSINVILWLRPRLERGWAQLDAYMEPR